MLSFLFVHLLQNPSAMNAAKEEVDRVVGRGPVTPEHMNKLPYISACLREALRMYPPVATIGVNHKEEDVHSSPMFIGKDQYEIQKDDNFAIHISGIHRDPDVYEDPDTFRPERMLDEAFNQLPPHSWKPFGNGSRACIGRAFAWQEAHIIMALLLQNFTFQA